jgi:RNA polymerase sigma-70 factor (ECF subfamily)
MSLLERFARGDPDAFEELFRQFQGQVFAWVVRIVRDPGAAEDLTVETFWRIYRVRAQFRPDGNFGAWAYRIATNLAINHLRRRHSRSEVALPDDLAQPVSGDVNVQQELGGQIQRAVRTLPAKLQVVVMLALVEERPYQEIAEALGVAVGTVKSRVFRAVRLLRKRLQRMGVENAGTRRYEDPQGVKTRVPGS